MLLYQNKETYHVHKRMTTTLLFWSNSLAIRIYFLKCIIFLKALLVVNWVSTQLESTAHQLGFFAIEFHVATCSTGSRLQVLDRTVWISNTISCSKTISATNLKSNRPDQLQHHLVATKNQFLQFDRFAPIIQYLINCTPSI